MAVIMESEDDIVLKQIAAELKRRQDEGTLTSLCTIATWFSLTRPQRYKLKQFLKEVKYHA